MKTWAFILCFVVIVGVVYGARILGIFSLAAGPSHFLMYERLMIELAKRGHKVDVVSHFPQKQPIPGYNDLSLAGTLPGHQNNLSIKLVQNLDAFSMTNFMIHLGVYETCEIALNTTTMKNLVTSTESYDVLITEMFASECMAGFSHYFKMPMVAMVSSVMLPWGNDRIGNPDNPAYIPNYYTQYSSKMGLFERIVNTIVLLATKIGYDVQSYDASNKIARNFFGPDLPDLREIVRNTSLVLVNSHFSINQARPTVPNFIEVGGLHISDSRPPLDETLENMLQINSNGVIYFSMGSMVATETFEEQKLQSLFDAFAELPYKVIWKGNKKKFKVTLNIPNKIHFETWMPQLDILCHPKLKLFVTHGGLMGSQEAVYCGVPSLGIPLFADQKLNVRQAVDLEIAIKVEYEHITKTSILFAARQLLEDPKYKLNAKKRSDIFKDRQNTPLQTAIYWVEYVLRYKGAPHLRSVGADLTWYQYTLIDVILICFMTFAIISYVLYFTTLAVFRQVFRRLRLFKEKEN